MAKVDIAKVDNLFEQLFKDNDVPLVVYLSGESRRGGPELDSVNTFIEYLASLMPTLQLDKPSTSERIVVEILPDRLALYKVCLLYTSSLQLEPSSRSNKLNVSFSWTNANPELLETEVTTKLEGAFARIRGLNEIHSTTGNGYGAIELTIDPVSYTHLDVYTRQVVVLPHHLGPFI